MNSLVYGFAAPSSGTWERQRPVLAVQLDGSQYTDVAEPAGSGYTNVVQLDRSEYTEVR